MSKIPYRFIPIPEEFLSDDFINDPAMMKMIRFIMKRISPNHKKIPLKNKSTILELAPYEFMFGRDMCSQETGLSHRTIRTSIKQLIGLIFIKKVTSKSTSTFTVFTLVTSTFNKNSDQHFDQQSDQHPDQHPDHKLDIRSKNKETTTPTPSFQNEDEEVAFGLLLEKCEYKKFKFSPYKLKSYYIENAPALCNVLTNLLDQKDISWMKTPDLWLDKHFKIEIENIKIKQKSKVKNAKTSPN